MLLLCLVHITLVTYYSVSNMNGIIMESIEETISNEYVDNLIDAIKLTQNIKKRPDCFVIYDYLSKSL